MGSAAKELEKKRKRKSSDGASEEAGGKKSKGAVVPKQKVLMLCSRGITYRFRHLMEDLLKLMPHAKKDSKMDSKDKLDVINEICEIRSCNNCIFFEVRKKRDLYIWFSKSPSGPTFKFQAHNVHTMDELKMTGNCLKGSRPILQFDESFDKEPHLKLAKELFTQIFATPKGHPNSKPFIDHVMSFNYADNRIWFRNYQVILEDEKSEPSLMEIGPRIVLEPIRFFSGGFQGATLYENPNYMSPTALHIQTKKQTGGKYARRVQSVKKRDLRKAEAAELPDDGFDEIFE